MRKIVAAVTLTAAITIGLEAPATAAPPDPVPPVRLTDGNTLTWTAPELLMGDAPVEFYAGKQSLGRATTTDHRTFSLTVPRPPKAGTVQVRAGGKRLDRPESRRGRIAAVAPAPAPAEPGDVDPGLPGPYRTVSGEYTLDSVPLPGLERPVEMQGVVVAPQGAEGPRPFALFLHGMHGTCYRVAEPEDVTGEWPCPSGFASVPSYRGYLEAQQLLASQGYVTVSISANGVNSLDGDEDAGAQSRSSLVRLHLARWAQWAADGRATAPDVVRQAPPADLSRVLLVGHSRGGEGVNRAAMDSLSPPPKDRDGYAGAVDWTIRGTLMIGPTIFGQNPVPDVPSVTILPGCDGDVSDLQGQVYLDETVGVSRGRALHSAVFMAGANHNFFNTEWTPGQAVSGTSDDTEWLEDGPCTAGRPLRVTAAQQQKAGATYIAAAARVFVDGDDRVRPLLDGSGVRAPSADPVRVLTQAVGGNRTPLVVPDRNVRVGGSGRLCDEVSEDRAKACMVTESWGTSPHFVSLEYLRNEPGRRAVAMRWTAPGQAVSMRPARPVQVSGAVTMRVAVPANARGVEFGVAVTDDAGRRTELGEVSVDGAPTHSAEMAWAQEVRVPLDRAQSVAELELVPRGAAGEAWLIDAWGWQPGTPAPRPVALPRVDVGGMKVQEGDSGTRTYQIPARVRGNGSGRLRLFVQDSVTGTERSWVETVNPDTRRIDVPVEVAGNTRYGGWAQTAVFARAERGLVIGDHVGLVDIREDDPVPTVTVAAVADTVAEGGTLTWRFTLSGPADTGLAVNARAVRGPGGPHLSSTDVDPDWFTEMTYGEEVPEPSRPLHQTAIQPAAWFPAGTVTADVTVPTVADGVSEPDEKVHFELSLGAGRDSVELGTVVGTVTD
ncbi:hypothetical protein [Jidongwangia harbinensis]|uniref:hypothetical protein n=1 Tax=Jidongwangia harbinensis TaxID=2878561 RepID=UPI001CD93A03|nr:hypothetical protein [Jidongwangia harbinensis]MCA2214109.1 hypothetical protein [Jidongwangia harbinensis]